MAGAEEEPLSEKRIFRLINIDVRRRAADYVMGAPEGHVVTVQGPNRTLEQNAALHAAIADIAGQVKWHGERMDVEDWKRLLTAAWARAEREPVKLVPALDGQGFDVLYRRTSRMSKRELSSLLDYLHAWGAEQGVKWSDVQYREVP